MSEKFVSYGVSVILKLTDIVICYCYSQFLEGGGE